jgi:hypothetical protein
MADAEVSKTFVETRVSSNLTSGTNGIISGSSDVDWGRFFSRG